jgi:predicted Zn-dependent peptidase
MASMLSYYEALLGDYRYVTGYLEMIEKVTADDIMRAAKKYLNRENRTVAAITGKGKEQ